MAKLSKRVKAFRERVDANKSYPLDEAIAILKETATAKFNESVEVAVNLGIDARKSDQGVRGATYIYRKLLLLVILKEGQKFQTQIPAFFRSLHKSFQYLLVLIVQ